MQRNNFWLAIIFLHDIHYIDCFYCKKSWLEVKSMYLAKMIHTQLIFTKNGSYGLIANSNLKPKLTSFHFRWNILPIINNPPTLFILKYRWIGGHIEETSWKAFFKSRVDKFRTKLKFPASKWGWKEHSSLHGLFGLNILDDGKLIAQNFVF